MSGEPTVAELLDEARGLGYGASRLSVVERAVALADEHQDIQAGFDARMELVQTAIFGGYPEKALVAFSWLCGQCDRDPEQFPESRNFAGLLLQGIDLLWAYKWVAQHTHAFPQISRKQIEETLDDMEERYRKNGYSLRPVYMQKVRNIIEMGGDPEEAAHYFEKWRVASRDLYADCQACEQHFAVEYQLYCGDWEDALTAAQPLVDEELGCAEIPHVTFSVLAIPLLRLGREEEAEVFHRRGYELCEDNRDFVNEMAEHLDYQTVTENWERGAMILERHLGWAIDNLVLGRKFRFFRSAATFLERASTAMDEIELRMPPAFPNRVEDAVYSTTELAEWFRREAGDLARRFDARNGNNLFSRQLDEHLAGF